jgi:hypothetical protein
MRSACFMTLQRTVRGSPKDLLFTCSRAYHNMHHECLKKTAHLRDCKYDGHSATPVSSSFSFAGSQTLMSTW